MAKQGLVTKADGIPIKDIEYHVAVTSGEIVRTDAPLTPAQIAEHKVRVDRILSNFQDIARKAVNAWGDIKWIKDNRTYRNEYSNFNEFCRDALGKDNSQIYRYIKDAELKEEFLLEAETDVERASIMSLKESNTRFIRRLPEEVQLPIWKLAYGIGTLTGVCPPKEDGSIEMTTAFLQSVAEKTDEIVQFGGLSLEGKFVPIKGIEGAAKVAGMDSDAAKTLLMAVGVTEEYFEAIQRQKEHIIEKSVKADFHVFKGVVDTKVDTNGSEYPVIVDSKNNEIDLTDVMLSYNGRFVALSLKVPLE